MASNNKKHVHKYYKSRDPSGQYLWTCGFWDCKHHMPKHYEHTIKGKGTVCWGHEQDCEGIFALDERAWIMDKPLCTVCDPHSIPVTENDLDVIEKLKEMGILDKLD